MWAGRGCGGGGGGGGETVLPSNNLSINLFMWP